MKILGDEADNVLPGTPDDDDIDGGAGNDTITGGRGMDMLRGGDGDDTFFIKPSDLVEGELYSGGDGYDRIVTSAGINRFFGATLTDIEEITGSETSILRFTAGQLDQLRLVNGGELRVRGPGAASFASPVRSDFEAADGTYTVYTRAVTLNVQRVVLDVAGVLDVSGVSGGFTVQGSKAADTIYSAFHDVDAGDGDDTVVIGNPYFSIFEPFNGAPSVNGGEGINTLSFANVAIGGVTAAVGSGTYSVIDGGGAQANFQNLVGSRGNDALLGDAGANELSGGAGDDFISGGAGRDTLDGGDGFDTVSFAGETAGILFLFAAGRAIGADRETVVNFEKVIGSDFDDDLRGDDGDNFLDGGRGDDRLVGGKGDDSFYIDSAGDVIVERRGAENGVDTVFVGSGFATYTLADGLENLTRAFDSGGVSYEFVGTGNASDNVIDATFLTDLGPLAGAGVYLPYLSATLAGEAGNDTLYGGFGMDTLVGGTGDDSLFGNEADDTLDGGEGIDSLYGGDGDDVILASSGTDFYQGGNGVDTLDLRSMPATQAVQLVDLVQRYTNVGQRLRLIENVIGGDAGERMIGDAAANGLSGNGGDDLLQGGLGDDVLVGGSGDDRLEGGDGDDLLVSSDLGTDAVDGGSGTDTLSYAGALEAVTVSLANTGQQDTGGAGRDTITDVENLIGTDFNDVLVGNDANNVLEGGYGDDILDGGEGFDIASYASSRFDLVIDLGAGSFYNDGLGFDTLIGIEGARGGDGADRLYGDAGDNYLDGAGGSDFLVGGAGADQMVGGLGFNIVSFEGAGSGVAASLAGGADHVGSGTLGDAAGDSYADIHALQGSSFGDQLTAGNYESYHGYWLLNGAGGNDILFAGDFVDVLEGGEETDTASYALVSSGVTLDLRLIDQANGDTLRGFENLTGSGLDDVLIGSDGANVLDGGAGDDRLVWTTGQDVLIGGEGRDTIDLSLFTREPPADGGDPDRTGVIVYLSGSVVIDNETVATFTEVEGAIGSALDDTIIGRSDGSDMLVGGDGNDYLQGEGGGDVVYGGLGIDLIVGQGDNIIYRSIAEAAGTSLETMEYIVSFYGNDILDLSAIDANIFEEGDQAFTIVDAADYTGAAGEMTFDFAQGAIIIRAADGSGAELAVVYSSDAPISNVDQWLL